MQDQVFAPKYTDNSQIGDFYRRKPFKKYQDSQKTPQERAYLKDLKYFNSHSDVRNHTIMFSRCYQKTCQRCVDHHIKHPVPDQFEEKLGLPSLSNNGALWYTLEDDSENEGHYKTYLQLEEDIQRKTCFQTLLLLKGLLHDARYDKYQMLH